MKRTTLDRLRIKIVCSLQANGHHTHVHSNIRFVFNQHHRVQHYALHWLCPLSHEKYSSFRPPKNVYFVPNFLVGRPVSLPQFAIAPDIVQFLTLKRNVKDHHCKGDKWHRQFDGSYTMKTIGIFKLALLLNGVWKDGEEYFPTARVLNNITHPVFVSWNAITL